MNDTEEQQIVACWHKNAAAWTKVVRQQGIESRRLVTDMAIVEAVSAVAPQRVLDVGCGEGWLTRALCSRNIDALGVDVVPKLIANAKDLGGGRFEVMSYDELASGKLSEQFDAVVCNFSLLGERSVEAVFKAAPTLLKKTGCFIVQTLHPETGTAAQQQQHSGWQQGSWQGIRGDFTAPSPWYFRTVESWLELFADSGFELPEIKVSIHPETKQKCAIIFTGELNN